MASKDIHICYACEDCHLYPNDDLFCDHEGMHKPLITGLSKPMWCPLKESENGEKE